LDNLQFGELDEANEGLETGFRGMAVLFRNTALVWLFDAFFTF
jgi:hypothetical protein